MVILCLPSVATTKHFKKIYEHLYACGGGGGYVHVGMQVPIEGIRSTGTGITGLREQLELGAENGILLSHVFSPSILNLEYRCFPRFSRQYKIKSPLRKCV